MGVCALSVNVAVGLYGQWLSRGYGVTFPFADGLFSLGTIQRSFSVLSIIGFKKISHGPIPIPI